jgi:hypothetical protein
MIESDGHSAWKREIRQFSRDTWARSSQFSKAELWKETPAHPTWARCNNINSSMFTYQCHHSYQYGNAFSQLHQLKPHISYQETSPTLCKQQTLLSAFPYSVLQCCPETIPAYSTDWWTGAEKPWKLYNKTCSTCDSTHAVPVGEHIPEAMLTRSHLVLLA